MMKEFVRYVFGWLYPVRRLTKGFSDIWDFCLRGYTRY